MPKNCIEHIKDIPKNKQLKLHPHEDDNKLEEKLSEIGDFKIDDNSQTFHKEDKDCSRQTNKFKLSTSNIDAKRKIPDQHSQPCSLRIILNTIKVDKDILNLLNFAQKSIIRYYTGKKSETGQ